MKVNTSPGFPALTTPGQWLSSVPELLYDTGALSPNQTE